MTDQQKTGGGICRTGKWNVGVLADGQFLSLPYSPPSLTETTCLLLTYVLNLGVDAVDHSFLKQYWFNFKCIRLFLFYSSASFSSPSFSSPSISSPSFSSPANSTPVTSSVIFQSSKFHPCDFVRHFPVLQIPVLQIQLSQRNDG